VVAKELERPSDTVTDRPRHIIILSWVVGSGASTLGGCGRVVGGDGGREDGFVVCGTEKLQSIHKLARYVFLIKR
jgi:hypothetical protein